MKTFFSKFFAQKWGKKFQIFEIIWHLNLTYQNLIWFEFDIFTLDWVWNCLNLTTMNLIWFEFEKKRLKHSLYQRNLFLHQCWTLLTYWLITTSKPRSCEWMLLPSNYPSQAGERFGPPKAQTETHSNFKGNGHTECVVWNFAISNCCRITVHNWHYVGKAKMYFRDGSWKKM